ncbi:MAG: hypothetical protein RLY16_995 [Bacteroidota bacterium]|jgi:hypothetical protein
MKRKLRNQQLILLGLFALLLFNFPLLTVANKRILIGGIPTFYAYLFINWSIIVYLIYRIADKKNTHPDE